MYVTSFFSVPRLIMLVSVYLKSLICCLPDAVFEESITEILTL